MTDEEQLNARKMVESWFWQPDSWHRKSLVRYYESAPIQPDALRLVIAYLKEEETDHLFILNKKLPLGETWKATDAWFQTSPSDRWNNTESTKIRIYQSFRPSSDESDGPYTVDNGCKYLVTHEFHWDVAEIPVLPESSSGIQYTLQGVSRDKDSGLYSCVVERRETIQQNVAEYSTAETAFETRTEEQHLGVKQALVSSTGKRASVAAGKIVRRRITKNPDCTSDVVNETVQEKPISGAVVEYRRSLRGTSESKTDRGQPTPVSKSGLAIGETRRSEKTEGGLWINTVSKTDKTPVGNVGEACDRSALEHRHTTNENVADKPTVELPTPAPNESISKTARRTEEDTWDVQTTRIVYTPKSTGTIVSGSPVVRTESTVGINQPSVPTVGIGGVNEQRRASASPNDHGSFSTTVERIVYIPAKAIVRGGTVARSEEIETGTNQPDVPIAAPAVNRSEEVSASPNDHGSFSTQKRTIVYTPIMRSATGGTSSQRVTIEAGIYQTRPPSGTPEINKAVDVSISPNENGSMTTQKRTIIYRKDKRTVTGGESLHRVNVETGVNQTEIPVEAVEANKSVDVSVSMNDHGSMSTQKRTIVYQPAEQRLQWDDESSIYRLRVYKNQKTPMKPIGSGGSASASFSINDHGTYDGTALRRTSKDAGSTMTLAYSYGPVHVTSTVYYMRNGKFCSRIIQADREVFYGHVKSVMKKVAEGDNCAMAGFTSGCAASGTFAHGQCYKNIAIGTETIISDEESI